MTSQFQSNDSGLSANGRFGRLSYLAWNMLLGFFVMFCCVLIAILMPSMMSNVASGTGLSIGLILFLIIIYAVMLYFIFVFTIRRLHDLNKSGWLSLIFLIPVVSLFFWIYISCAKGDDRRNNFGQPRKTQGWEKVLAWLYIVMIPFSIGLIAAVGLPAYQSYVERAQHLQYQQQINYSE